MNDTLIIAIPAWGYWLLVVCLCLNSVTTVLNLFNKLLQHLVDRSKA